MNRKIKYLFFLVSFTTLNISILIVVIAASMALSELVFGGLDFRLKSLGYILALVLGAVISIALYRTLYRYAENKWYIHRIFDRDR